MIFTAYIDESDTHGSKPDMSMGALLGSGRDWTLYGRGLRGLQRKHGFKILHAVEFKTGKGDYADWPDWKFPAVYNGLGELGGKYLREAVSVRLPYDTYNKHFLDALPPKMHRTSQYGVLFLATLDCLTSRVFQEGENHRLSVVVESGHRNAPDTGRLFKDRQAEWKAAGADFLKSHTLAAKADSPFLMAADFIAHGNAMEWRAMDEGKKRDFGAAGVKIEPQRGEPGWTVSLITPEYLAGLIDRFKEKKAAKHEDYLSRKAAFWAKKSS
jgi:hypothetical protein